MKSVSTPVLTETRTQEKIDEVMTRSALTLENFGINDLWKGWGPLVPAKEHIRVFFLHLQQ